MNTEVQKQESQVPSTQVHAAIGQEEILKSDIILPKFMLMQALSDHVKKRRAQAGDIVKNTTGEKVGGEGSPLLFIPLTYQNLWMLSEDTKGKGNKTDFEFRGYEERNALNENAEWDFIQNDKPWKRTKVVNVYALLPAELEKMAEAVKKFEESGELDLGANVLPTVIQFRNSSFKAGKSVIDLFVKARDMSARVNREVPAYSSTLQLEAVTENNGEHDYYVFNVKPASATKKEYLPECKRWREFIIQLGGNVKINESEAGETAGDQEVPF